MNAYLAPSHRARVLLAFDHFCERQAARIVQEQGLSSPDPDPEGFALWVGSSQLKREAEIERRA